MSVLLKTMLYPYMAPAGDDGADAGGGTVIDRGDDLATLDDITDVEPKDEVKDEEPEAKLDDKGDEDEPRDDKGKFIPKSRFDEAVRKEREQKEEYARRLKEFEEKEAQRAVSEDVAEAQKQVKDLIKQHTSLLADGELDKASDLMERILGMQADIAERKADAKVANAKEMTKEEMRYDALVARLETDYPAINPESDEFDKAAVKKVQAYMTGLMQTEKMSASQALKEAVETLLDKKADTPAKDKAEDLTLRRKEAAVKKAIDAKAKQPASNKDVGVDHDKIGGPMDASAIMKLSQDEFNKLPESALSKMRGDFI